MSFFRTAGGARRALPLALAGATFALVASSSVSLAGFTVADGRVDMRTGAHNAPVSIAGTSSGSQVARLSLTKGN